MTDAGMAHLGRLNELELLSLDDTQVTDAGLAHLKGLKHLKWLKLSRPGSRKRGCASFRSRYRICSRSLKTQAVT